jgi:hypothetical protein
MQTISITELVAARIAAKRAEDDAVKTRRELDKQLADLLKDPSKPEGSVSRKEDGFKLTVTYKIDRKVDSDALSKEWDKLDEDVRKVFRWKADASVSELRKLEDLSAKIASRYITSKEASPSITIEAV